MHLDCITGIRIFSYYKSIRVNTRLVPRLVIEWCKLLDMPHAEAHNYNRSNNKRQLHGLIHQGLA